jgi:hypothetical protein
MNHEETSHECDTSTVWPWWRTYSPELAIRFALVAVAVGLCYLWSWTWLRVLTSELNIRLDALAGISLQRLEPDTVYWRGVIYRYGNACTFVDVWCGAIPLLWNFRRSFFQNLSMVLTLAAALFAFNVARLSFSDVLFSQGLSWNFAHNVMSGVAYFLVWTWIRAHGPAWSTDRSDAIHDL